MTFPKTFPERSSPGQEARNSLQNKEAPIGIEPMMEVLQTSALPLGYGAGGQQT
jgi:hypothetical protein